MLWELSGEIEEQQGLLHGTKKEKMVGKRDPRSSIIKSKRCMGRRGKVHL